MGYGYTKAVNSPANQGYPLNWSLLRSYHALICLGIGVAVAGLFWSAGWPIESNGLYPSKELRYGTGIAALVLMLLVSAFVIRKYAHRGGYSPEFRLRASYEAIQKGNKGLIALQSQLHRDNSLTRKEIERKAQAILRDAGAHKVNRAIVEFDAQGKPTVRVAPKEPLGRLARWLRVHTWYGILFGPIVLLHGGLQWPSTIGQWLIWLTAIIWFSGLFGLFVWAKGPSVLTRHERDLSIEEAHSLHEALVSKISACLGEFQGQAQTQLVAVWKNGGFRDDVKWNAIPFQSENTNASDLRSLLGQEQNVHQDLRRLRRIRWVMMGWKLFHVPAVIALILIVGIHMVTIFSY